MDHGKNNFDFLRMLAAWSVIVSHNWPLHDHTYPLGDLGAAAVYTFFSISGYLVFASWDREPNLISFIMKRILRIFPALIVVTLVGAFIVGPLATTASLSAYFSSPMIPAYLRTVLLYPMSFALPGVFTDNPFKSDVNSAIYTLAMEFAMYIGVGILGGAALLRRNLVLPVLVTLLACIYAILLHSPEGSFLTMDTSALMRSAFCFVSGMIIHALSDRRILVSWAWIPIGAFLVLSHHTEIQFWALLFLIPYGALSFALHPLPYVHLAGRFGDPSYGVYIYAFMIQQSIMHWLPSISIWEFLLLASILSLIAGYASWYLIEKRALRLKKSAFFRGKQTTA
ncbi:acyltransferase [Paraburkholderia sp. BL9I2N2]|jgi:peptidoglycan/LPS O-acetylase OafA/YrhL|uniref:acyltransferase family protein n=1 Tax=Paraburkholderia sp. BL9I2N2 TaxID=1938809 RepID=UPI00104A3891|nr:acyltransferase [Paraburkholderia sp. BL9I2N2]TCK96563.1 peptidoglycan/LPS O-acetylase OafA/YrhL [Paraburkholderia sp. BL9I2N2]